MRKETIELGNGNLVVIQEGIVTVTSTVIQGDDAVTMTIALPDAVNSVLLSVRQNNGEGEFLRACEMITNVLANCAHITIGAILSLAVNEETTTKRNSVLDGGFFMIRTALDQLVNG